MTMDFRTSRCRRDDDQRTEDALTALQRQLLDTYGQPARPHRRRGLAARGRNPDDRAERRRRAALRADGRAEPARLREAAPSGPAVDVVGQPRSGLRSQLRQPRGRLGSMQRGRSATGRVRAIFDAITPAGTTGSAPAREQPGRRRASSAAAGAGPRRPNGRRPGDLALPDLERGGAYPKNTKIVWHHNVYEAKWWTQGDVPDAPVS